VEQLIKELVASAYSLKLTLDNNTSLNDQLKKFNVDKATAKVDADTWKSRWYKRDKSKTTDMKELEERLSYKTWLVMRLSLLMLY